MFEQEFDYFKKTFLNLPRFRIDNTIYQPFVDLDKAHWGLEFPDIFYHIASASKVRDCSPESPIFPCCNTVTTGSCSKLPIKSYQGRTGRIPCPFRAKAISCAYKILTQMSVGNFSGVQMAMLPKCRGRTIFYVRSHVGPLDYFMVFKVLAKRHNGENEYTPLMLLSSYPLTYRQMISAIEGSMKRYPVLPFQDIQQRAPRVFMNSL